MPLQRIRQYYNSYDRRLWVLSLGWFVSALGFAVSIPFIAIYFHSVLGLSITQIGLFFGAMAVVRSPFQILGGEVADILPPKQRMDGYAMMGFCSQFAHFAQVVVLVTLAEVVMSPRALTPWSRAWPPKSAWGATWAFSAFSYLPGGPAAPFTEV